MLEFKFPDVGEGIHEGTIVKWRVKENDEVKSDQILVEIETDKAIVEIPSPRAGVIAKMFHKEQELINVGETLVVIVDKGETYDPAAVSASSSTQQNPPIQNGAGAEKGPGVVGSIDSSGAEIPSQKKSISHSQTPAIQTSSPKILPATRMLAQKLGVDISKISGTGPGGLITDSDVKNIQNSTAPNPNTTAQSVTSPSSSSAPKTFPGEITRTPYKGIRKVIGDHMVTSLTRAAQVTHVDTIDVSKLVARRESEKSAAQSQNIKLTFLAYITKAVAETLKEFPIVNSELDDTSNPSAPEIVTKNFCNIGIAVDTEEGLFVPTIKDTDKKDLLTIAQEITDLADRARAKKLTSQDMSGGTFTITNYGSIGGDFATPVINYPEAAILGLGKIRDALALDNAPPGAGLVSASTPITSIRATKTMTLALTFDHRIIDGATAARFVNALGQKLQA